ncbi:MAG: hypothetical protein ACRD4W_06745, partial [Nitrososphaeraceae archaeon]
YDQSTKRLVSGIAVAVLFFVAFVFSYALPASAPSVPWYFYSIAGIFVLIGMIFGILVFDKELYGENDDHILG